ncbi:E3 ubiquitin-protein ligase PRT1 isoform X2 [Rosa chinensis]|uniref:E3 ubiquitin-protein ligase PRT1 isoform X2 n=1 Tax=Rosa chinensis TaxID=74649 RepID=UPI001AD8BA66|nr:E3 ubiquitin-protein ligase PRT1 isoform X2 [Rosa chinensis]
MENHHISSESEEEEFSDRFVCCMCLELLYKPIVLSCGHVSCFWCVHRSMSGEKQSHCPLCRHPYNHFPTICQLLHCLLLNSYPVAYKKRELQILEEEKKTGYFSPQLDVQAWSSQANQDSNIPGDSVSKELSASMQETVFDSYNLNNAIAVSRPADGGDYEGMENVTEQVKYPLLSQQQSGSPKQISVADVLCAACKQLLFRPVVLNCGHGEGKSSKEAEKSSSGSYHRGVGCDYCGMYPIIGDRYRCKDCVEKIGFDLCNDCYNTSSKLPGRFNQQHTAEHQFELIRSDIIRGSVKDNE